MKPRASARKLASVVSLCMSLVAASASAGELPSARAPGGPIHGVKVLSDQVEDLSSIEAISAHLAGLSNDAERAAEIFRLSNKYRHQSNPPHEFLGSDDHVHEPVKIFNVYGYCKCCCAAALLMALGRHAGMPARGWALTHHSVSELFYGRGWHMLDLSLMNYFITDDGRIASVNDLIEQQGRLINRAHSPFIDEHNIYQSRFRTLPPGELSDYEVEGSHIYEYTYTVGHRIGLSLRAGESILRAWGNQGRHVNERQLDFWQAPLDETGASRSQLYLKDYYPGYKMGLVGNGELRYDLDFAHGSYLGGVLSQSNVEVRRHASGEPALMLAAAGSGEVVVPFASSYVLLGAQVHGRFFRSDGATITVSISRNHGRDWQKVWTASGHGVFEADIDLEPLLFRRYQYLARIQIKSSSRDGAGLLAVSFTHDIQHAQRSLPLLVKGDNRVTVTAPEPTLATQTIEAALQDANDLNASYRDFDPIVENLEGDGSLFVRQGANLGTLTFPVETPGPLRALRFGGSFRCRGPASKVRLLVSLDAGRSWNVAGVVHGPSPGIARYVTYQVGAANARSALVRYEFSGPGAVGIFVFRVDADYLDRRAGERPVKVTYEWTEEGVANSHAQVVTRWPITYSIQVQGQPIMKSIKVEGLPNEVQR